jgi:hypothetical protein
MSRLSTSLWLVRLTCTSFSTYWRTSLVVSLLRSCLATTPLMAAAILASSSLEIVRGATISDEPVAVILVYMAAMVFPCLGAVQTPKMLFDVPPIPYTCIRFQRICLHPSNR